MENEKTKKIIFFHDHFLTSSISSLRLFLWFAIFVKLPCPSVVLILVTYLAFVCDQCIFFIVLTMKALSSPHLADDRVKLSKNSKYTQSFFSVVFFLDEFDLFSFVDL